VDEWAPDPTVAVMAHGLLNSMAIITGAGHTLRDSWDELPPEQRLQLLTMITEQSGYVSDMLSELARGLPVGVLRELDALAEGHVRGGSHLS
jgi:hypothetical protein